MSNYITAIKVNHILHLQDFVIPVDEKEKKHLIITGKNGSGKTILLNAVIENLSRIVYDKSPDYMQLREGLVLRQSWLEEVRTKGDKEGIVLVQKEIDSYSKQIQRYFGTVELSFADTYSLVKDLEDGKFIIAYYADERKSCFLEPKTPVKPDLRVSPDFKTGKVDQFLNFMVDCKIQEALARNEGKQEEADHIRGWFNNFREILGRIFEDRELKLSFDYRDYSFRIETKGKSFKFTELSAGYSAVLDIVADLILKMQEQNRIIRAYEKEGIVLIDEIETHLHLELQRLILPILSSLFPNIQFIVTTHSPFILNSLPDIVAFDLEHREPISDLTDYSYEALAEGYFGVKTESGEIEMRLDRMEKLISSASLSVSERKELEMYLADFEKMPEMVAPNVKARYYELNRLWNNKAGDND